MTLFFDFLRCEGLFESFLFDVEGNIVGLDDLFDFHVRKVFGSLLEVVHNLSVRAGFRDVSHHDCEIRGRNVVYVDFIVEIFHLAT